MPLTLVMDKNTIQVIGVKNDAGAGTRGARQAYEKLLAYDAQQPAPILNNNPTNITHYPNNDVPTPFAKHLGALNQTFDTIQNAVYATVTNKCFPLIIAGDHSNATGTIAGIKRAYPISKIGVIWIDAHADLHTPYTSPSGNVHGMPIAASLGIDNLENQKNILDERTKKLWEVTKNIANIQPKITAQDLVYIGVRSTEKEERAFIKAHNIQQFSTQQIRSTGGEKVANLVLNYLSNVDKIYISFDVDVLDWSLSKATGTPVENGVFFKEALRLIKTLSKSNKLVAFEIAEINQSLEPQNEKMLEMGYAILKNVIQNL